MTDENNDTKRKQAIIEAIKKADLPEVAKKVGTAQAIMGGLPDSILDSMMSASNAVATQEAEKKAKPQRSFANYTPIERQIARMLTENTGVDMMDSGGAYGRAWQRNREIEDFRKRPAIELDIYTESQKVLEKPIRQTMPISEKQKTLEMAPLRKMRVSIPILKKTPAVPKITQIEKETAKYVNDIIKEPTPKKSKERLRA